LDAVNNEEKENSRKVNASKVKENQQQKRKIGNRDFQSE
jgi:hypothetical protein